MRWANKPIRAAPRLQSPLPEMDRNQPSLPMKQWNPREWSEATKPWEKERPGAEGMQPACVGWYGVIFNESPPTGQQAYYNRVHHYIKVYVQEHCTKDQDYMRTRRGRN